MIYNEKSGTGRMPCRYGNGNGGNTAAILRQHLTIYRIMQNGTVTNVETALFAYLMR